MGLVVTGQVHHRELHPDKVREALSGHISDLTVGDLDFYVERKEYKVQFFCNNSRTLDFAVLSTTGYVPAPAMVSLLVRETESLRRALAAGLDSRVRKAKLNYCVLEDQRSRNVMLQWVQDSPLKSAGARLSYLLSLILILSGLAVLAWLDLRPGIVTGRADMVAIAASILVPAMTLPLPFVFEWLRRGQVGRWIFVQGERR